MVITSQKFLFVVRITSTLPNGLKRFSRSTLNRLATGTLNLDNAQQVRTLSKFGSLDKEKLLIVKRKPKDKASEPLPTPPMKSPKTDDTSSSAASSSTVDTKSPTKSLNWLIKPERERTDQTSSTIDINIEDDKSHVKERQGTFYHEKIVLGYSREQMCEMVGNVSHYKEFVPFCINSEIIEEKKAPVRINLSQLRRTNVHHSLAANKPIEQKPSAEKEKSKSFAAKLEIGYPPIKEAYVSNVNIIRPLMVKSISRDTRLFEFLINEWKFHPYNVNTNVVNNNPSSSSTGQQQPAPPVENSCIVEFYVSFKFRSPMYARLTGVFMDQIFKKMMSAFTKRAAVLYGKPSMEPKRIN